MRILIFFSLLVLSISVSGQHYFQTTLLIRYITLKKDMLEKALLILKQQI